MLRHLLTANITDPVSNSTRGNSIHTLYFSGQGSTSPNQTYYLDRKHLSNGQFDVYVNDGTVSSPSWTKKTSGTDYVYSSDDLTLTWTGCNPSDEFNDNIKVVYSAIKPWIYDDNPRYDISEGLYPRITVEEITNNYDTFQIGEYSNYSDSKGNMVTGRYKIIVRLRRMPSGRDFKIDNITYKNADVMNAVVDKIKSYVKNNVNNVPWLFFSWNIERVTRVPTEEDLGIFRKDIDLVVKYFDNGTTRC